MLDGENSKWETTTAPGIIEKLKLWSINLPNGWRWGDENQTEASINQACYMTSNSRKLTVLYMADVYNAQNKYGFIVVDYEKNGKVWEPSAPRTMLDETFGSTSRICYTIKEIQKLHYDDFYELEIKTVGLIAMVIGIASWLIMRKIFK